jgi:hypothetical protein
MMHIETTTILLVSQTILLSRLSALELNSVPSLLIHLMAMTVEGPRMPPAPSFSPSPERMGKNWGILAGREGPGDICYFVPPCSITGSADSPR